MRFIKLFLVFFSFLLLCGSLMRFCWLFPQQAAIVAFTGAMIVFGQSVVDRHLVERRRVDERKRRAQEHAANLAAHAAKQEGVKPRHTDNQFVC